jgi:hypothetical protein
MPKKKKHFQLARKYISNLELKESITGLGLLIFHALVLVKLNCTRIFPQNRGQITDFQCSFPQESFPLISSVESESLKFFLQMQHWWLYCSSLLLILQGRFKADLRFVAQAHDCLPDKFHINISGLFPTTCSEWSSGCQFVSPCVRVWLQVQQIPYRCPPICVNKLDHVMNMGRY